MLCFDCENCHQHSDGATFCIPYAARRAETDKPLEYCTKFVRRAVNMVVLARPGQRKPYDEGDLNE